MKNWNVKPTLKMSPIKMKSWCYFKSTNRWERMEVLYEPEHKLFANRPESKQGWLY